ncbi:MAG: response regulator SirA [Chloroflexi bacterium]|nr:response regulator SirA [Chloroflexota bacterium]
MAITSIVKRSGAIVPFNPARISNAIYRAAVEVGGRDRALAEKLASQVVQLLEAQIPADQIPTVEQVQDAVEKVLIENGHAKVAKAYILYREEHARMRRERADRASRPSENIPWAKIYHALDWACDHGVNTIAGLNERIARGEFADIVRESEAAYNEDVENAAEMILERRNDLKIVIITGPSSSGKTTTTIKVGVRLKRMGFNLVTLNVDNYFFNLDVHPKDEFGDYDFETPQALDLALINQHLVRLIAGEEVLIPFYDMKTGQRHDNRTPMKLKTNDMILIDSLHGLYPDMTQGVPNEQKFKLYLEPLLQMKKPDGGFVRWADLRLIRRMLRDAVHRAYDPRRTLLHWHYVRNSEMRNIISHINETDYIVNTGMPFELPIYRPRLLAQFAQWEIDYQNDPLREDAYNRAKRVHAMLEAVTPIADDSAIPGDSVLREFIGGSVYKY